MQLKHSVFVDPDFYFYTYDLSPKVWKRRPFRPLARDRTSGFQNGLNVCVEWTGPPLQTKARTSVTSDNLASFSALVGRSLTIVSLRLHRPS